MGADDPRPARIAVLHQGFIPTYRVRLFELLDEVGVHEYVIFHGAAPRRSAHTAAEPPFAFPEVRVRTHELASPGGSVVWQSAVRPILSGFDAVILGSEMRLLANVALFPILKTRNVPVLLWGQGGPKDKLVGPALKAIRRASWSFKWAAARRADGFLAYTAEAKRTLVRAGVDEERVFVLGNTIDVEAEVRLHAALENANEQSLRAELGLSPDSALLLFIGRLYREKRVEALVRAVADLRANGSSAKDVEAVVIGAGSAEAEVQQAAAGVTGVRLEGEIRDRSLIAKYMRVASAVVIPGAVGLAVNHAFAHGVPVITQAGELHGPELEYIRDGVNGVIADPSQAALARAIERVIVDDDWQASLAAGALRARSGLGLEAMAKRLDAGVTAVLARRRSRL